MKRLTLALVAVALIIFMAVIPVSADYGWSGTEGPFMPRVTIESRLDPAHMPPGWDTPCQGECIPIIMIFSPGDKIEFHGENSVSDTTWLFISGPGRLLPNQKSG